MSGEFTSFFGQEAGHEVGFSFDEKLDRLVGRNLFLENRLADSDATFIGFFGHVGSEVRFFVFVNFDHRF